MKNIYFLLLYLPIASCSIYAQSIAPSWNDTKQDVDYFTIVKEVETFFATNPGLDTVKQYRHKGYLRWCTFY